MQSWEASNLRIYSNRNSSVRSNITPPLSYDEVVSPKPAKAVFEETTNPPCYKDVVSQKPAFRKVDDHKSLMAQFSETKNDRLKVLTSIIGLLT